MTRAAFVLLSLLASCAPAGVAPTEGAPVCCAAPLASWSAWASGPGQHVATVYLDGLTFAHAAWSGAGEARGGGPAVDYRDAAGCIVEARVASLELADPVEGVVLVDCAGVAP